MISICVLHWILEGPRPDLSIYGVLVEHFGLVSMGLGGDDVVSVIDAGRRHVYRLYVHAANWW